MEILFVLVVLGGLLLLVVVLPIAAYVTASDVRRRVGLLEREVRDLRAALTASAEPAPVVEKKEPAEKYDTEVRPIVDDFVPYEETPGAKQEEMVPSPAVPSPPVASPAPMRWRNEVDEPMPARKPKEPKPARSREDWELLIGGNVFNRIGAIAILIGVAFFLKYAFDHNWITPWMLFGIGIASGIGLVLGGRHFYYAGAKVFSQGLSGAGISVLYLTIYSAFNLYHIVSQYPALAMMTAVTAIAIWQSLKYDAIAVALLGLAGGFLTPVLLGGRPGAGPSNPLGLLGYLAVLDIGLLAVSQKKPKWFVIEPLALASTYLIYLLWYTDQYTPKSLPVTCALLTVYWLLFYAIDVIRIVKDDAENAQLRTAVSMASVFFYYLALYAVLDPKHHQAMGLVTLAIGAVYMATCLILLRRHRESSTFAPRYVVTAIAFLVMATGVQYKDFTLVSLWSVEAALLLWAALHWQMRSVTISSIILYGLAIYALCLSGGTWGVSHPATFHLVLNDRFAAFAALAASLAFSGWLFRGSEVEEGDSLSAILDTMWVVVLFAAFGVEVNDQYRRIASLNPGSPLGTYSEPRALAMSIVWSIYSIPIVWAGLSSKLRALACSGLVIFVTAGATAMFAAQPFHEVPGYHPWLNIRSLALVVLASAALIHRFRLEKNSGEESWIASVLDFIDAATSVVIFDLLTLEIADYFTLIGGHTIVFGVEARYATALSLAVVWSIYSLLLLAFARRILSPVLAVCSILSMTLGAGAIAIFGAEFNPAEYFSPIINARCLAFVLVAVCLMVGGRLMARTPEKLEWLKNVQCILPVAISLLIFELLTAETWSYFERIVSSDVAFAARQHLSDLRQAALSVVWILYSVVLMSYGFARRARSLRLVAMLLFEITILKVFLYDLSSLETLYRIFSFIALGLILMATSYLYYRFKGFILDTGPGDESE